MEFRLLGPLEAVHEGEVLRLSAGKQRALLAVLLLNANRTVSREQIIDDIWGEDVPGSARKMVQIHVSQLRKALPEPRVRTSAPGYVLEVGDDDLDLSRFERLVADGRRSLSAGDPDGAGETLAAALEIWRGPALAEFSEPFAAHEGARLEELRLSALEWRIEADLACGRHGDVVAELETQIGRHPLRERLRIQHVLALYRSGRHADALAACAAYKQVLDEELGIEPSAALRELERQILRQDPALDPPISGTQSPPPAEGFGPVMPVSPGPEGDISFARSDDVRIAYQVVGDGSVDIVLVHGWVCPFQPGWENPKIAGFYRDLAALGRLILFDKRGTGLSDRVSVDRLPDLETRMDDVRAVLDAVGSERAVVLGISEGGAMSTLFAATHPKRTMALVLMGSFARRMWAPDYPIGLSDEEFRSRLALNEREDWTPAVAGEWIARTAPDLLDDSAAVRWYVSYLVRGASPGANKAIRLMNAEIDIREVLPTISVPTLVVHREDEYYSAATRYMGGRIPGARLVALPGNDHLPWEGDRDAVLGEIGRFVSGIHAGEEPNRVLATLLVTDVVGHGASRDVLARYRHVVQGHLDRFRGQDVDNAGHGVLATFDGPARAVRCASAIIESVRELGLDVRAGVHTGEIERLDGHVRGLSVDIGARIAALAGRGEVLVSGTVKDIVAGSGLRFDERGEHELAGVPGTWRLFAAGS